ncbi:AAA family ATPase [Tumidithrix elongata RA019]|uniref:AAA family ATPase n=1 Tax=Tumidithrix elongata BACA0141 TaxID=2716417 RepID=A0AAW9PQQ7_9CYAN|nr:AAA family ATPase [Tumidithrix elongata RA019]
MSLPILIEQMLSPDFYNHEVTEPIVLMQTHISFVLLTGKYAYKIKKPMNFGFLDFSTLEKRHHFCQEEIRLNRRLAPELYLGVKAIVEKDGKFAFASDEFQEQVGIDAVEYAIQMPQFSQDNLLIELFEAGKLTLDNVVDIGKQLATFHTHAATSEHIASFGTMSAVRTVAEDNYQHTQKYIGIAQTQDQFDRTRAYTEKFFAEHDELFRDRIAQGKVKECHGDLHLKNICIYNGKIQIFDCIEFNEPFRNSDVVYDAAFLFMDLQFRGRPDLANAFLNTYLERTGDYAAAQLLPLYCSMRAYIRAKVTSFLLDDPNIPADVKQNAQQEASAYYQLAYEYTQPQQGKLWLMSGLSGSGKSTTAKALAQKTGALHLRSDAVRKHLAGIDLMERGGQELYTPEMTQRTYNKLCELGILLAKEGFTVILDAKYDRLTSRSQVLEAADRARIPTKIIYCHAPIEVLKTRVGDRTQANRDIADATVDLLASQKASFEDFTPKEKLQCIEVDTTVDSVESILTESLN